MATKRIIQVIDDLDGEPIDKGVEVVFSVYGIEYALDLSEDHARDFHDDLRRWVAAARPAVKSPLRSVPKSHKSKSKTEEAAERVILREWARREGYPAPDRGRIPQATRRAYEEAVAAAMGQTEMAG